MGNKDKKTEKPGIVVIPIAILGLGLLYYMASTTDTLGASFVGLPLLFFLAITLITYSIRAVFRKELKRNIPVILLSILGIPLAFYMLFIVSDKGLRELNMERKRTFQDLRPIFLKYKQENGTFPKDLDDLVPKYINQIPPSLINEGKEDPYKKISYSANGEDAIFWFHSHRGPDSSIWYSMAKNRYEHQE